MMTKFHLKEMKISKTSLAKISRINEKSKQENSNSQRVYIFQQRMNSLNFATIIFRFDIVFATVKLAQFLKNSNSNHVIIANRMIVYLNEFKNFVIEFSEKFSEIFLCANNVAYADDELIRKSSDDYLFKLYDDSILTCNQASHDDDIQHRDKITDSESNREEDNLMKTIFRVNSIQFDEKFAYTLRQSLNSSCIEKRDVKT